ncbi:MAG: DUF6624 domain-containing protein [Actinocatenispora sp.]
MISSGLAARLLAMRDADQAAHRATVDGDNLYLPPGHPSYLAHRQTVECNTGRLKAIVDECGWPTISMVGREAASAAWLLAQHSDHDPAFQSRVVDLMAEAGDDIDRTDWAYLVDRLACGRGEPQEYGTQLEWCDGGLRARKLRDPGDVDRRRTAVGLQPLAEYLDAARRIIPGRGREDASGDQAPER